MMKYRVVCLFVTVAAGICLATAQNSQVRSSSTKSGPDSLQTATKPLTPKSAMPVHPKSSAAPAVSTSGQKTSTELTHLERQNIKAQSPKSGSTGPAKSASVPKPTQTSASGSGIDFKYQKPVGGMTASTPGANSKASGTPRVKKN
jgi:hypothetical protein